jgi:dATP pyrophosphohydrolase
LLHTAVREVQEETGIRSRPQDLLDWQITNTYEIYPAWRHRYAPGVTLNTEHVMSLCVARTQAVVLSAHEHQAWQWLDWREAADACFSPSNAEAILLLPRFYKLQV